MTAGRLSVWEMAAAKLEGSTDPNDWRKLARPEQLPPEGDWHIWLIVAGRGYGKMLALDTMIPTPRGWAKMGDLGVGDVVFDEAGAPCNITATFDGLPDTAYRVSLSDGTWVDACSEHQWVTWTHAERKAFLRSPYEDTSRMPENWPRWRLRRLLGQRPYPHELLAEARKRLAGGRSMRSVARDLDVARQGLLRQLTEPVAAPRMYSDSPGPQIRTTQEIADTRTYGKRGDLNHCIPVAEPLQLPDLDLPVDPYVLGAWLGDGSSASGDFTCHEDDQPALYNELSRAGYQPHPRKDPQCVGTYGLSRDLRTAGVLGSKHVPSHYLRSSAAQRLALLQGLMDTDGSGETSSVEFCNTRKEIVDGVVELARSLGQKPVVAESRATLYGRDCGPRWRVTWRPTISVFRLARKAQRLGPVDGAQGFRNQHRMIIDVSPIPVAPMRCLTVDSPNSMYLCGDGMIPTHNTRAGAETLCEWARTTKGTYAVVGPTFGDARAICVEGAGSGLIEVLRSHNVEHTYNRSLYEIKLSNGSLIVIVGADTPDRLRGYNLSGAWADEIASWRRPATWYEALMPALRIGKQPRAIVTGTPKPVPLVKELMGRTDNSVAITRGRTMDNAANLSKAALDELVARYQGTRLGRQELEGELLEDVEGALWTLASIELARVTERPEYLTHVCISVDPAGDGGEGHDEHGITVSGVTGRAAAAEFYMLADLSRNCTPSQAARTAILAYVEYEADCIVYEKNQGQGWITAVLQATWLEMSAAGEVSGPMPPLRPVNAARSKRLRAEPVQALYEQGRVHHVGIFAVLESQQTTWIPGDSDSPDRLDSAVHGITWLYDHARHVTSIRRPPQAVLPSGISAAMGGQALGSRGYGR